MSKLHEILAVEGDLKKTATVVLDEAKNTLAKKPDHFLKTATVTKYFDENDIKLNTDEYKALVTTVGDKLEYVGEMVTRYYDAYLQKEATNQHAKADVVIDGNVFLTDVPVVVLLGMETKLKELRDVYEAIPTLRPGPVWEIDPNEGKGVYRAKHDEKRFLTKKTRKAFVKSPATDKHPAQVETIDEDVAVAERVVTTWSSMLSVTEKSLLLDRLDNLIQAFKKARQRANEAEIVPAEMGKKIFTYLHAGT
jgi:hypothetical protein